MNNPIHRRGPCWRVSIRDRHSQMLDAVIVQADSAREAQALVAELGDIEEVALTPYTGIIMRPERQVGAIAEATNG